MASRAQDRGEETCAERSTCSARRSSLPGWSAPARSPRASSSRRPTSAIGRLNGELNAFVTLCEERALAEADAIQPGDERPLAGVPIAIKDLGRAHRGHAHDASERGAWATSCPTTTAPSCAACATRARSSSARRTRPSSGILPVTEPDRFGPTRNPWDTAHTPGGSSGGSAGAVASGMVPIAHANDGGGSIRIPASCCGLVGLKPSRGRVSMAPDLRRVRGRHRDRRARQPHRRRHGARARRHLRLRDGRPLLGARPRRRRSSRPSTASRASSGSP